MVRPTTSDVAHPEELIGSRGIIQGASGAGKSYALRRILEETHGRMQHLVLDVEDMSREKWSRECFPNHGWRRDCRTIQPIT
ncbi:MAG: hypothetical protein F9K29_08050 [Hyphomicrobiaceae bacterium]|nr:MAG: hypothetical protein F9K29_08050 [Hyphomicrobiaceae bacterium]